MRCNSALLCLLILLLAAITGCHGSGTENHGDAGLQACSTSDECMAREECLEGVCLPFAACDADSDCPTGYYCSRITGECYQADCLSNRDCDTGQICLNWICHSVCLSVTCGPGEQCDPETGECQPMTCTVSPVQCRTDQDCPRETYCDPVAHGCTECPTGFFCNMHSCAEVAPECSTHSECADGQRCNPDTLRCEAFPDTCASNRDCQPKYCNLITLACQDDPFNGECREYEDCQRLFGPEYYCHPRLHNCVMALDNGQCYDTWDCVNPSLVCDLNISRCIRRGTKCWVDLDCDPDHACIDRSCTYACPTSCNLDDECPVGQECWNHCCAPDNSCNYDADCAPTEYCANYWCYPRASCQVDDEFEDNDSITTATRLEYPQPNQSEDLQNLLACRSESDFYYVVVPAGEVFSVTIFFTGSVGNLNLWLGTYPDYTTLDHSTGSYSSETVSLKEPFLVDTILYLEVYEVRGDVVSYDMRITRDVSGQNQCSPDDGFEENDGWTTATRLSLPVAGSADDYSDLIRCTEDNDWYEIHVPASEALAVRIFFDNDQGNLDLLLLDSNGCEIDISETRNDFEEVSAWRLIQDTTFFVRVSAVFTTSNEYVLRVENPGGSIHDCYDGGNEPNELASQATDIDTGLHEVRFICMGASQDRDWYRIPAPVWSMLMVRIEYPAQDGDLNLYLYDCNGSGVLDVSTSNLHGFEEVYGIARPENPGFLIEVNAASLYADTPYRMSVAMSSSAVNCGDGDFEPNDVAAMATSIGAGTYSHLCICGADDQDWYLIQLDAGERLKARMLKDAVGDVLSLDLYAADGTTLLESASFGNILEVDSGQVQEPATFLLRVMPIYQLLEVAYVLSVVIDSPVQ